MNVERLERDGSGYVGRHEPDILFAARPLVPRHRPGLRARRRRLSSSTGATPANATITTASTGPRAGSTRSLMGSPRAPRLATCRSSTRRTLVALHRHPNEWFVRQARRVLADRSARGGPLDETRKALAISSTRTPTRCASSGRSGPCTSSARPTSRFLRGLLDHEHESVRAWAIRLLTDDLPIDTIFSRRVGAGRRTASPICWRSSRPWLAMIHRAWCGWCWRRRCSGCR